MLAFLELLKIAIRFIFPHFLTNKNKTETNRVIELHKSLTEIGHKDCEVMLTKSINRKVSKELYGAELDVNQIQMIEKAIADSAYEIRWKLIKESSQYLTFSKNELNVKFTQTDNILNWAIFVIGITAALSDLFFIWFLGNKPNTNSWQQNFGIILFLIVILLLFLGFMFSSLDYFSARKLKSILKKSSIK